MELILFVKIVQLLCWLVIIGALVVFFIASQRQLKRMQITPEMHRQLDQVYADSARACGAHRHE